MKYTIFGTCVAVPSGSNYEEDIWGGHFDSINPKQTRWYVTYEQSNMQIATHVMMMSKPDSINIVQLANLHRKTIIDTNFPKSANLLMDNNLASSCFADIETTLADNKVEWSESTWQKNMDIISLGKHDHTDVKFESDADKSYIEAYSRRNYLAEAKWELHTAIAMIDAHAKATGKDIRLMPRKHSDFDIENLSTFNKMQIKSLKSLYNPKRVFWYKDQNNKPQGVMQYKKDNVENIVSNYLQPWLDGDI
jgi:hypothetical protein